MDRIEQVYKRIQKLKEEVGITYTAMAKKAGISQNAMEKFTGKSRRITEDNLDKLVTYLVVMGY